jgi:anti-sigma-K factor RskA
MERQGIHELSAAYALHALAGEEERAFEEHLAHCDECREHVAAFQETTAAMAYEVDGPSPSPALRERILARARGVRAEVVPLRGRRRWALPATAGLAAAAACAAIALGIWSLSLSASLADERTAAERAEQAVSALAQADARRIPLSGAEGSLVVGRSGEAWLVVVDLEQAPDERTYEAWVIEDGAPAPAGLFAGGGAWTVVKLSREVTAGAVVAVTLERAGGVAEPTQEPLFTSDRAA